MKHKSYSYRKLSAVSVANFLLLGASVSVSAIGDRSEPEMIVTNLRGLSNVAVAPDRENRRAG